MEEEEEDGGDDDDDDEDGDSDCVGDVDGDDVADANAGGGDDDDYDADANAGGDDDADEEIYGREGLSKTAQDLKTLAAVLDNRARERLRTEGYSGNETDITMTQSRESMLAEAEAAKIKGEASTLDFEHCFTLAAPEEKDRKYEH